MSKSCVCHIAVLLKIKSLVGKKELAVPQSFKDNYREREKMEGEVGDLKIFYFIIDSFTQKMQNKRAGKGFCTGGCKHLR